MSWVERRRALADLLGVDERDCRCHDKTGLYAVKIGPQREIVVIARDIDGVPNVEGAADALRTKLQKTA